MRRRIRITVKNLDKLSLIDLPFPFLPVVDSENKLVEVLIGNKNVKQITTALILAGGKGKRLGELTKHTPKSLIDINGQSILERQISIFKKLGISDITVIIGPHTEKFTFKNISFVQDKNYLEHDILSSLMLARSIMYDDIIVSYGDVIFDEQILQPLIDFKDSIGVGTDLNWEKNYVNRTRRKTRGYYYSNKK